jgi:hypothetical protein
VERAQHPLLVTTEHSHFHQIFIPFSAARGERRLPAPPPVVRAGFLRRYIPVGRSGQPRH